MFGRVAGRYDLLNTVMTAGLHHSWRHRAVEKAELAPGESALDVCCGTGDLALELARRVAPGGHVVGCDFSEPMLDLAREKAGARGVDGVRFEWADALRLPYDAGRFDAVTVGFGVRNLADLDRGLHEMARVLRPGDRWSSSRSRSRRGRLCRPSSPSGSTGSCRCWGASPTMKRPTRTFPSRSAVSPLPRETGRDAAYGGVRADPLDGPRRGDHRDPQRRSRVTRPSAVPPPVTAVLDASSRWLPARLGEVGTCFASR